MVIVEKMEEFFSGVTDRFIDRVQKSETRTFLVKGCTIN